MNGVQDGTGVLSAERIAGGERLELTRSELEIMNVIWAAGRHLTRPSSDRNLTRSLQDRRSLNGCTIWQVFSEAQDLLCFSIVILPTV